MRRERKRLIQMNPSMRHPTLSIEPSSTLTCPV